MTIKNGKLKKSKRAKSTTLEIELYVAPRNGTASREVVARWGDLEFPDKIDTDKASARDKFAERLGAEWKINDEAVLSKVKTSLVAKAQEADALAQEAAKEAASAAGTESDQSASALEETSEEIIAAAEAFLCNPNLIGELADDLERLGIAGERDLAITEYMIGTSRLLEKPLGGSVKSASSSGKSFVAETVATLMPEEQILVATDISPNALYYMPAGSLRHKFILVGERKHIRSADDSDSANATLSLREMMSRGRLDKYVTMSIDGRLTTVHITQEGPISYLETTTQQEIFEEDASRMLTLATDESSEQTSSIMSIQAQQAAWATGSEDERKQILAKHHAAQRLLESLKVRIPYAARLNLPATKLVARRAFPQLLGFIEAVALLRQRQKVIHPDGHIDADLKDYRIAYRMMLPILHRTFAPLSQRAIDLLGSILSHVLRSQSFSR